MNVSTFVLGTMTFGDTASEAEAAAMLDAALAAGVTMVDTANGYAGGATETILGSLLVDRSVAVATKAGIPHPDAAGHAPLSAKGLTLSVEGSLRRLRRESVDLLYLHQPDRSTPLSETLSTVAELVSRGLVGALGVSNFAAWQIADVISTASRVGAPSPVVAQQLYNLLARHLETEYAEFAGVHDLHTMVYNPLGGGLLTGRFSRGSEPSGGRFGESRLAEMYKARYFNDALLGASERLGALASAAGLSLVELSFRWLFSKDVVGSVLLGASRLSQLEANLALATAGPLPDDLVAACDAVGAELFGPMPAYNR